MVKSVIITKLVLLVFMTIGWLLNLVQLVKSFGGHNLSEMMDNIFLIDIVSIVGVFLAPLGSFMGYLKLFL